MSSPCYLSFNFYNKSTACSSVLVPITFIQNSAQSFKHFFPKIIVWNKFSKNNTFSGNCRKGTSANKGRLLDLEEKKQSDWKIVTFKGLVTSCHSFYFNYFSISSQLTPRIGPPYGGTGAGIELLAGQQADALLSELRRTLSELCRTLSELRCILIYLLTVLHPYQFCYFYYVCNTYLIIK